MSKLNDSTLKIFKKYKPDTNGIYQNCRGII